MTMSGMEWNVTTLYAYHGSDPSFKKGCQVIRSRFLTKAAWDAMGTVLHPEQINRMQLMLTVDLDKKPPQ